MICCMKLETNYISINRELAKNNLAAVKNKKREDYFYVLIENYLQD